MKASPKLLFEVLSLVSSVFLFSLVWTYRVLLLLLPVPTQKTVPGPVLPQGVVRMLPVDRPRPERHWIVAETAWPTTLEGK